MEYKEISRGDLLNLGNKVMKGMRDENESDLDLELEELESYKELARRLPKHERKNLENLLKFFNEDGSFIKVNRINYKNLNELETLRPVRADNLNMPNNRFLNMVTGNEEVPYDGSPFPVMKSERTEEIESTVTLNYENDDIQIAEKDKRFTEYDRCVHEAICTLHEVGNTSFTPDQVYRTMNGLTADKTVSPLSTQKVVESIDKMRKMQVTINYSDEFRKRLKSEDNTDYYYAEGSVIQAEKRYARLGGHEVLAYYMLPKPIIYRYAQATRQVITIPTKLLSTADVIRNTPENTTLRNYLVRRIEAMKNRKNSIKSNRILFETIYKQIGLEKPTAKKSMKVRDAIEKYLEHYKSKNYIKDFKFYKTGRTFKGIEISL